MIARNPQPHLLTDAQMKQFISNGFLPLNANVSRALNEKIYKGLTDAMAVKGQAGNNTLPQVPELHEVFETPIVRGALTSVLGPGYITHQHRHTHYNGPGQQGGGWHKDSYWGYTRPFRDHRPWWVMIMYFPQDTPIEIGPTAVLPGAQNWDSRMPDVEQRRVGLTGEAGTCALIHFDLWHAALPNTSDKFRHMCKFQFVRMEAPKSPTWDCQDAKWSDPRENLPHYPQRAMWRASWDWYAGRKPGASVRGGRKISSAQLAKLVDAMKTGDDFARTVAADEIGVRGPAAAEAIGALVDALSDPFEGVRLNAAYALAAIGEPAVPALTKVLTTTSEMQARLAFHALGTIGEAADASLLDASRSEVEILRVGAAYALGLTQRARPGVVEALLKMAADPAMRVRYAAIDSLGQMGKIGAPGVPVLIDRLRDAEAETRFNAALALARIGPAAAPAVEQLKSMFLDSNRYVRGYAVEALHRIGTREAIDAVIAQLKATRWCPITAVDNHFYP